jgi:hypothetical protein
VIAGRFGGPSARGDEHHGIGRCSSDPKAGHAGCDGQTLRSERPRVDALGEASAAVLHSNFVVDFILVVAIPVVCVAAVVIVVEVVVALRD